MSNSNPKSNTHADTLAQSGMKIDASLFSGEGAIIVDFVIGFSTFPCRLDFILDLELE